MLRTLRRKASEVLRQTGVLRRVANSKWRQRRLLILCYHGISQEDEHLWRPALYMERHVLEQRFEIIRREDYNVVPLGSGLRQLRGGTLPPRSVAITFDDGMADFFPQAFPLLKSYGFPVTVYQTTYYTALRKPIFNLMCSYLLWKRKGEIVDSGRQLGLTPPLDLRTEESRDQIVLNLMSIAEAQNLSGPQKDELARELAGALGIEYDQLLSKRLLHVMNPREIAQLAAEGVDFQLHTHRHRAPLDANVFRQEIRENRQQLQMITNSIATHFCYPSGVCHPEFMSWLAAEDVVSASTCDPDLANAHSDFLRLPRFVDTSARSAAEFESWLSGVGGLTAVRRGAGLSNTPAGD